MERTRIAGYLESVSKRGDAFIAVPGLFSRPTMNRAGMLAVCVVMVALPAGCGQKAPPAGGTRRGSQCHPARQGAGHLRACAWHALPGRADRRCERPGSRKLRRFVLVVELRRRTGPPPQLRLPGSGTRDVPAADVLEWVANPGQDGLPDSGTSMGRPASRPMWFVYEIVKADTNGDGHWDYGDELTIAVSDAAGRDYHRGALQGRTGPLHVPARPLDPPGGLPQPGSRLDCPGGHEDADRSSTPSELPSFGPDVR